MINESELSSLLDNKQETFWSLIIDTQIKYEFKVQTNFNHIELQELEKKFDKE